MELDDGGGVDAKQYVTDLGAFEEMLMHLRCISEERAHVNELTEEEFQVIRQFFNNNTIMLCVNEILDSGVHELRCCEENQKNELPLNLASR